MRICSLIIAFALMLALFITGSATAQKARKAARPKGDTSRISSQAKAEDSAPEPDTKASSSSDPKDIAKDKEPLKPGQKVEKATFGGGCFWCQEAVFERIPGVLNVTSGYAGGNVPYPSYEQVHSGLTGHAEVVQIEFDPAVVSYERLLNVFWVSHDPTKLNMQADDVGPQYRSIILYSNEDQREVALKSYQDLKAKHTYRSPIMTELVPLTTFYPAEPYHQNYYGNNAMSDYSISHILPKLRKLNSHGAFALPRKETAKPKEKAKEKDAEAESSK